MMVNTRDRWVYKGSVTTPPCATYVYWNVLTTIYPIKQATLDSFKNQLKRKDGLDATGNWREIQKLDKQAPKILKGRDGGNPLFLVLFIVFLVLSLVFIVTTLVFFKKAQSNIS